LKGSNLILEVRGSWGYVHHFAGEYSDRCDRSQPCRAWTWRCRCLRTCTRTRSWWIRLAV